LGKLEKNSRMRSYLREATRTPRPRKSGATIRLILKDLLNEFRLGDEHRARLDSGESKGGTSDVSILTDAK